MVEGQTEPSIFSKEPPLVVRLRESQRPSIRLRRTCSDTHLRCSSGDKIVLALGLGSNGLNTLLQTNMHPRRPILQMEPSLPKGVRSGASMESPGEGYGFLRWFAQDAPGFYRKMQYGGTRVSDWLVLPT